MTAVLRLVGQTIAALLLLTVLGIASLTIIVPRITGSVPLTVLTGSMAPGMPPGTLAVVRPVDPDDIGVGDVITYQIRVDRPGVISHRVTRIAIGADGRRSFTLQGDANADPDPASVVPAQVMGRVWYSLPGLGFVNTAVSGGTRAWLVPTVGTVLISYAVILIVQLVIADRRRGRSDPHRTGSPSSTGRRARRRAPGPSSPWMRISRSGTSRRTGSRSSSRDRTRRS
jgi:signal peptidase